MRAASLFGVLLAARLLTLAGTTIPVSVWTPVAYLWQDITLAIVFGLADYVKYYLTAKNIGAIALTLCAGVVLPMLLARWKPFTRTVRITASLACIPLIAAGPYATSKVDTAGRYRNAFGALWPATRIGTADLPERSENHNWRVSPFPAALASTNEVPPYRGAARGRNVVMVLLDSTGARYWPPQRSAIDPMPNLTQFAAHGVFLDHAYAVYPESIKGFFSVLCSRYPAFDVAPDIYARIQCPSLPQLLANAGYRTALFHSGRFMYLGMESVIEKRGFDVLEDAGAIGGKIQSSF